MKHSLRIVVVAPDLDIVNPEDDHATRQAERSRSLRIGAKGLLMQRQGLRVDAAFKKTRKTAMACCNLPR